MRNSGDKILKRDGEVLRKRLLSTSAVHVPSQRKRETETENISEALKGDLKVCPKRGKDILDTNNRLQYPSRKRSRGSP